MSTVRIPIAALATAILASCDLVVTRPESQAQAPLGIVEAVFEAFNRHDAAAMAELYAPEAVLVSSEYCEPVRGREAIERVYAELFAAVPDIEDEVLETFVDGDRVAVRFVSRSRLAGREFETPIADFFHVRDGLIVGDRTIFNAERPCRAFDAE